MRERKELVAINELSNDTCEKYSHMLNPFISLLQDMISSSQSFQSILNKVYNGLQKSLLSLMGYLYSDSQSKSCCMHLCITKCKHEIGSKIVAQFLKYSVFKEDVHLILYFK